MDDDEALLRRFDPLSRHHIKIDEGDGSLRLRSGALDLAEEGGMSVYRESVLHHYGMDSAAVVEGRYRGIAWLIARGARACGDSVSVVPDPWPTGELPMPHRDVAHALVTCAASKSAARRLTTRLALAVSRMEVPSVRETRAALASVD